MRKFIRPNVLFVALVPLALAGCGAEPAKDAVDRDAVAADVESKVAAIIAAVNSDDVEGTVQFNAPDYEFYSHGLPNVAGAEAVLENTKAMLADPAIHLEARNPRIEVAEAGDMAIYTATYDWAYTDPASGKAVPETGNWILIFRREADGSLKVIREIASDVPPEPPA